MTVAHALERIVGPVYPAPQVLARLREGMLRELDRAAGPAPEDPTETEPRRADQARALWTQARRALPHMGQLPGMQTPDPALSLRVPTAASLAQGGLLRMRTSAALLSQAFEEPDYPDPDRLDRADTVLEGASQVLSDHESKVVLRGHGIEITRPALSDVELIDFPGLGSLEAFNTDGLRTLLRTNDVPDLKEKTLRYPGHCDQVAAFVASTIGS